MTHSVFLKGVGQQVPRLPCTPAVFQVFIAVAAVALVPEAQFFMHGAGDAGAGPVAARYAEGGRAVSQPQGRALMPRTQAVARHAYAAVGGQHARKALKPVRVANLHVVIQLDKTVRRARIAPGQVGGHGHAHIAF